MEGLIIGGNFAFHLIGDLQSGKRSGSPSCYLGDWMAIKKCQYFCFAVNADWTVIQAMQKKKLPSVQGLSV